VKDNYLFSTDEIQQKLATINLFEKFDTDGSGALDVQELTVLYNDNGINVTEGEIKRLYDDENVMFTLPAFEDMSKDINRLRIYRNALKKLKNRLVY
jgi:Ca2+-binding EF-hand superfamily protein